MIETIVNSPMFGLSLCLATYLLSKWIQRKTKWAIGLSAVAVIAIGVLLTAFLNGWITLPQPQEKPTEPTIPTEPKEDTVIAATSALFFSFSEQSRIT